MPIRESVTVDEAITLLNEMLKADSMFTTYLIDTRLMCNKDLSDHPTIQCQAYPAVGNYKVGILGILNGLFGTSAEYSGAICAVYKSVCPDEHDVGEANITCPVCGKTLETGPLKEFKRI